MKTAIKTYRRTRAIYVVGDVAFVANPSTRSSWWKTHASVAIAACPECKAAIGDLCKPSFGFCRGLTHARRRRLLPRGEQIAARIIAKTEAP